MKTIYVIVENQFGTHPDEVSQSIYGESAYEDKEYANKIADDMNSNERFFIEKVFLSKGLKPRYWKTYEVKELTLFDKEV